MVRRLLITAAAAASSTMTRVPVLAWTGPPPSHHTIRPFTSSILAPSLPTIKAGRKRPRPIFPEALSTVDRMKKLRAQARLDEGMEDDDGGESDACADAPISEPSVELPISASHHATIVKWLQDLVIGFKLCPWAGPALNANAIRIVVHPEESSLEVLFETAMKEASLLATMPDGPEEQNLTTLIGVPGSTLADFQDFLDVAGTVDDFLDELQLRGKVQLASFHPDYRFADSRPGADVENFTNRSPIPILHLLREVEVSRALEGYMGDPSRIYERNKAVMREAGAEKLQKLIEACKQHESLSASTDESSRK